MLTLTLLMIWWQNCLGTSLSTATMTRPYTPPLTRNTLLPPTTADCGHRQHNASAAASGNILPIDITSHKHTATMSG
jgi:hypothetical protein